MSSHQAVVTPTQLPAHAVQLYEAEPFLVDVIATFVEDGFRTGDASVIVATEAHLAAVHEQLAGRGWNLAALAEEGQYLTADAAALLSTFMDGDAPNAARFIDAATPLLRRGAGHGDRRVRVFGEMVALLCADGNVDAAIRLEQLWNDIARTVPFSLLCAYPRGVFEMDGSGEAFAQVCGEHTHVRPTESYELLRDTDARLREVARLQQQAGIRIVDAETQRQTEELQARYAAIVESSDDAIISKTLDGTVTSWNLGATRLFGYTADEMIGQPISRLIPPERQDDLPRILGTIGRGQRVEPFVTERMRKDGTRLHVSMTVSPIKDRRGRVIGASKIARDVTQRKRDEAELEQLLAMAERARSKAETANRAKDEFLAMLGHELRNPLSAARNAIAAARLDDRQRERSLEIAHRQTGQLARLVDDLLDVARITQGRIVLHSERTDLADLLSRAVEMTRSVVTDRGLTLTATLPADDIEVFGDPTRLEQVVVNLLGNAAKYTPRGGSIRLVLQRDGSEAVIRVVDTGVGIEPSMLPRVFDLFAQATTGLERAQGGLGIGLTVVQRLVQLHGGQVAARSDGVGKGAEFIVRLPTLAPAPRAESVVASTVATPRASVRVLLVEDNLDAADSLTMLLEILGHRVRVVHDGAAALDAARANVPDVMLVDIGLPGMDGYEVARRIRRDPLAANVVLVALTGYGRDRDKDDASAAGFDHHLVKPVEFDLLQRLITDVGSAATKPAARSA